MRAVMAKLKKKRGGDFGRQRRRSRTAADMTKDEAALAIQKSKNSTIEKKAKFSSLPIVSSKKVTFCLSCVVD